MLKSPSLFGDWISCCLHWVCVPTYSQRFIWLMIQMSGCRGRHSCAKPNAMNHSSHQSFKMPFDAHVASFHKTRVYTQVHGPFFAGGVDNISWLSQFHRPKLVMVNTCEYYKWSTSDLYPMMSEKWAQNYAVSYQIPCFPMFSPWNSNGFPWISRETSAAVGDVWEVFSTMCPLGQARSSAKIQRFLEKSWEELNLGKLGKEMG